MVKQYKWIIVGLLLLMASLKFIVYRYDMKISNEIEFYQAEINARSSSFTFFDNLISSRKWMANILLNEQVLKARRKAFLVAFDQIIKELPDEVTIETFEIVNGWADLKLYSQSRTVINEFCNRLSDDKMSCYLHRTKVDSSKNDKYQLTVHFDDTLAGVQ